MNETKRKIIWVRTRIRKMSNSFGRQNSENLLTVSAGIVCVAIEKTDGFSK